VLSFPLILTGVLSAAGLLLAAILLVALLPRRESQDQGEEEAPQAPVASRNGEGFRK
jgi:hypothetical protein